VFSIKRFETAYAIEYHVSNIFETNATVTIIPKEGTGIKYVKTRLQEAFPNAWEMSYGPIENKWEVKITVKKTGGGRECLIVEDEHWRHDGFHA